MSPHRIRRTASESQLRFLRIYDRLLQSVRKSGCPLFGTHILAQAWDYQMSSEATSARTGRKPLSLEEKFYVYVILDPRYRGPYSYTFCDKKLTFPFLPIYVGKGHGARDSSHVTLARLRPTPEQGDHKTNTLRKILRMGLEPIVQRVSVADVESVALSKEAYLIEVIGRSNIGAGPLTNLTDGGEGATGVIVSEETRRLIAIAGTGRVHTDSSKEKMRKPKSASTRQKMSEAQLGNVKGHGNRGRKQSPEHLAALSAVRKGRLHSAETKAKMSAARKGKKRPLKECPHCGTIGPVHSMGRWHFNNCKFKDVK